MSTPKERLLLLEKECESIYDECERIWSYYEDVLQPLVQGQHVLEIGCGSFAGLAKRVTRLGASSYHGIDIDHRFTRSARSFAPEAHFTCDDPVYVIQQLKEPHVILSTGVMDTCILKSEAYRKKLVAAIAAHMLPGMYTAHWAGSFQKVFDPLFVDVGLIREHHDLVEAFGLYRKS